MSEGFGGIEAITPDPFWDGGGSAVRCSSVGDDASRYLDPARASLEQNGRSVASLLPGGARGLQSVIIPRSRREFGSRGFDANKPRLINIDPDIKGQSSVVDLSKIDKRKVAAAYKEAERTPGIGDDDRLIASATFRSLAISTEPVGMSNNSTQFRMPRMSPIGGAYVVPKAGPNGSQLLDEIPLDRQLEEVTISPAVTPFRREPLDNVPEPLQLEEEPRRPVEKQATLRPVRSSSLLERVAQNRTPVNNAGSPPARVQPRVSPPTRRVTFEARGWGQLPYCYHDVVKANNLLVLVYEDSYDGPRLFPPVTNSEDPDSSLAVQLDGDDRIYEVHSTGATFNHNGCTYCILVIENEVSPGEQL